MQENFPGLELRAALFYDWPIGIRFKLGVGYDVEYAYENSPYLNGVNKRANTLFQAIHASDDDLYMVVDVYDFADGATFRHKLNIFSKYIGDKNVLFKLQHHTIPFVYPEDNEDGVFQTHRFTLKCNTSDIASPHLIKAICNQDMGLTPSISHRVYFINRSKNTIFHIYDDRGCDLIATSVDTIRGIYQEFNEWILDYDREQIDKVFKVD
ncbi:DUF3885 domain-containing protein [Aquibacillus kalidii]|uniref:DUF3885 domain-containing protein n=1 Tax=Aquibacillus kalidii TaxID=2762597 RepID=UPI001644E92D|nr:DUF3885 domain-containing protein [Aquibacillus kalidii]